MGNKDRKEAEVGIEPEEILEEVRREKNRENQEEMVMRGREGAN